MNAYSWNRLTAVCAISSIGVATSPALAVEMPGYLGFESHHNGLPNPDRPYEMISGTVQYFPESTFSLYDLELQATNPGQLDVPTRNEEGDFEFDSKFDVSYRAMVSFGLEPVHPIVGTGKARAVGRAAGGGWPFEPLVYETELLEMNLLGLSPIPEAMIRESPTLESRGVTIVEDLCPMCASPLSQLRIRSFFEVFTEMTLSGGGWAQANEALRLAQYPTPTTPGDYNSDGLVDAADYVFWRDNIGRDFSLPNDDTRGVDESDHARWRMNFGEMVGVAAGPSAAVPEPRTAQLLMLSGWWYLFVCVRGRRQI